MTKRGPIAYITSELVNNQREKERAVLKLMKQNHCFYLLTSVDDRNFGKRKADSLNSKRCGL